MIELKNTDCLELMKSLPDASVDLMLTDPPYGVTQNKWDIQPNFAEMWLEWERIVKPHGAFVFTAQQPFASDLILSRRGLFKYELIWEKSIATGFLNAKKQPLRSHENILVFYRKQCTYNPQKIQLQTPSYKKTSKAGQNQEHGGNYGKFNAMNSGTKDGSRYPRSVMYFKSDAEFFNSKQEGLMIHPTQKPTMLMRYLVRTYSNPGDTVFDGYSGGATTAIACIKEKRRFIGSEIDSEYYHKAIKRIQKEMSCPTMF